MEPPGRASAYAEGTVRSGEDGRRWVARLQTTWSTEGSPGVVLKRQMCWLPEGNEHRALAPGSELGVWTYFPSLQAKSEAVGRWAGEGEGPLTPAARKRVVVYEARQQLSHCLRVEEVCLGLARGRMVVLREPAYAGREWRRERKLARQAVEKHARRVRAVEVKLGWRRAE